MSTHQQMLDVLRRHPLIAGVDFTAGHVICDACHLVLGDPAQHLSQALALELDPDYELPKVEREPLRQACRVHDIERCTICYTGGT